MLRRERLDSVQGKCKLKVDRLLGPKRTVIVESRDPFRLRYEGGITRRCNTHDKFEDRFFSITILPGREWIGFGLLRWSVCSPHQKKRKSETRTRVSVTCPLLPFSQVSGGL